MNEHNAMTAAQWRKAAGVDGLTEKAGELRHYRVEGVVSVSDAGSVVIVGPSGRDMLAPIVGPLLGRRVAIVVTVLPDGE